MNPLLEILLVSMRDAFLQVAVFVAVMVLLFSWVQYRTAGGLVELLQRKRRWQPLTGALMGLIPGCGGAIIMMPLYTRQAVTFGTVIATLIATLGDSAFVIISRAPYDALLVHAITFVTAVAWGYLVDWLRITHERPLGRLVNMRAELKLVEPVEFIPGKDYIRTLPPEPITQDWGYRLTHQGFRVWWVVTLGGLLAGVWLLARYWGNPDFVPEISFNPATTDGLLTLIGLTGTLLSVIIYLAGRHYLGDDTLEALRDKLTSREETLIHAASETAFVTFWVLLAYLFFAYGMHFTGTDLAGLADRAGILAVITGAVIGIVPGCGPQVITVTAYTEGLLPFPALAAHAISQDGDALFPLLARNRMASLWATVHTTVPALLVGTLLYLLDFSA